MPIDDLAGLMAFVTDLRRRVMPHLADPDPDPNLEVADPARTRHQLASYVVFANLLRQHDQGRAQLLLADAAGGPREVLRVQTPAGEFDIDVRADEPSNSPISAGPAGSLFENTRRVEQPLFFSVDIHNALLALAEASQVEL
jgi:hypothetical protein